MSALRDAALEAANRGWYVIPLREGAKQPITTHGLKDASDDLERVIRWWQEFPSLKVYGWNLGVVCNPSGLVVLDIDPRHDGDETFARAEKALGRLPLTVSAITGGGGSHYFFQHPGGPLRGQLGPGLDVKDFGYVLISPSRHPSGGLYHWDEHPDETEVATLPAKWIDALQISGVSRGSSPRPTDPNASVDPLRHIPAHEYVSRITGREPDRNGFYQCPFHGAGQERTPSLRCDGIAWACYGCPPPITKQCQGGGIYDFMSLHLGLPAPPRGGDYLQVKDALRGIWG